MGKSALGRVIDKEALDASTGARGRFRVEIPARWAALGSEIDVALPARVECARCDGGGCDSCARSGALKTPADPEARSIRLQIPPGSTSGVALRVTNPFADAAPIEQMIFEVRCADEPSRAVTLVSLRRPPRSSRSPRSSRESRAGKTSGSDASSPSRGPDAMSLLAAVAVAVAALAGFLTSR